MTDVRHSGAADPNATPVASADASRAMQLRQGDVLLVAVDGLPAEARVLPRERGRVVLALGEATGHGHAIASPGTTLLEHEGQRFARVDLPAVLEHEEHRAIAIPPGTYRVVIQREYAPDAASLTAWRRVAD